MSDMKQAIDNAVMFIDQIEYEFSDLIKSYNIGNPRAQGIYLKVNGVKDALKIISEEAEKKPKEKIVYRTPTKTTTTKKTKKAYSSK